MMGGYVGGAGCAWGSRMHLLVFLLAVVAAGAQDDDEETEPSVPQPFNPREAIAQLAQYDHTHPGFLQVCCVLCENASESTLSSSFECYNPCTLLF